MRILLATDHFPPYIGGAQIQSMLLARELRDRGHDVAVATVWQDGMPPVEYQDGIPVHRFRQLRTLPGLSRRQFQHHQPPFPDPVTTFGLRRLINGFRPDLVHSYGWFSYSCATALLGKDIPLLITARDFAYSCANRTLMRDQVVCSGPALQKCVPCAGRHYGKPKGWIAALGVLASGPLLRRKVTAIHSISTYVRDIVRRDFIDDRPSQHRASEHLIHDVIASMPLPAKGVGDAEIARRIAELPSEPFILFIGALRMVKGVRELLAAYSRLESPPTLVMLGTQEPDTPEDFAPGVLVLEDFPHDAVLVACERCLFGVMPSLWPEPFGTVVCEVMSKGRPVIGTAPGGHSDMIVDGETGYLVPRGDVDALTEAMQRLLVDPDLRERLGRAARERAEQFEPRVALPRIEHLYEELLAKTGRAADPAEPAPVPR